MGWHVHHLASLGFLVLRRHAFLSEVRGICFKYLGKLRTDNGTDHEVSLLS